MGTMDALDSQSVDTNYLLKDISGERLRLEQKQIDNKKAVTFLANFWSLKTAQFTEPILNDDDEIITPAVAIEILDQFHPDKQDTFIDNADLIDSAFAFVMDGIIEIYTKLYDQMKDNPSQSIDRMMPEPPQNLTMNIEREKTGILGNIFQKYKEPDKDAPFYKMEKYLAFLNLIEQIWLRIRDHHEKSVAGVGINFSNISRREGMESRCGIYRQYFLAWVKPAISKMIEYVVETRIKEITKMNLTILSYQAQVQRTHEKQM
jgi:hypothetical protein